MGAGIAWKGLGKRMYTQSDKAVSWAILVYATAFVLALVKYFY